MVARRFRSLASVFLAPLTLSVLSADVTLRYKTDVKMNPSLPPEMVAAATKGVGAAVQERVLRVKDGRGFSTFMGYGQITDFSTKEITLLDNVGRRYAKLKSDTFGDEMAHAMPQMPPGSSAALASMKANVTPARLTGRTAVIHGVEVEEREIVFSMEGPAMPNMPPGPMMKMVMQVWTAKPGEAKRVAAISELTGYSLSSYATMNPAASIGKMMNQFPGFSDAFESLFKEMNQGTVLLRMHLSQYMPAMAAILQRIPAGSNPLGTFDPEAAFMEMNQEAAEISTAPVPDSVFQIPEGYQEVGASELFKGLLAQPQAPAAVAEDVNSMLNAAHSARSANNFAAAEEAYNAAFERAISKEMQRLSPVALEVATFFVEQRQPEKGEAILRRALDAEEAAGQPLSMEIPVLMRMRDVERTRRNIDLAPVETRLVKAWESLAGPESVVVANNLYSLSGSLEQSGQFAEAEQAIQRGIAILERNYGINAPSVGFALGRLASIETRLGKDDLAKDARNRESATRQKPSAPSVYRVGGSVTAPRVISKRDPEYSETARKAKIQGSVMLSLTVNANGEPDDIAILLPLGQGLDEKAVEAVKNWRFQPGAKDGQPVPVQATIEVNFRLL